MLTKLKKRVEQLLVFEAIVAHGIGLSPNMISFLGFTFAIFSALTFATGQKQPFSLVLASALLFASGFCDALDGVLARNYGKTTVFGGFLDSLLDRYADASVYIGIIVGGLCDPFWGLVALAGSFLVSYSRARAEASGIKMESVGIAERAERILILSFAAIAAAFWVPALNFGIVLLAILTNLTVVQRGHHVYKLLKKK